jgi:hypothetical protein
MQNVNLVGRAVIKKNGINFTNGRRISHIKKISQTRVYLVEGGWASIKSIRFPTRIEIYEGCDYHEIPV